MEINVDRVIAILKASSRDLLDYFDENKDGTLDPWELSQLIQRFTRMPFHECACAAYEVIIKLDKNHDTELSVEEIKTYFESE